MFAVQEVFNGNHLRAYCEVGQSTNLIITFDHWRTDRCGFPEVKLGSHYPEKGFAHLRIDTAANDWFENRDLAELGKCLKKHTSQFKRTISIGFSMGAYGAILLHEAINFDFALLVSPHYPPNSGPPNKQWKQSAIPRMAEKLKKRKTVILYDPLLRRDKREALQTRFPDIQVDYLALPGGGHPVTNVITKAGFFCRLQKECMSPNPSAQRFRKLHEFAQSKLPMS